MRKESKKQIKGNKGITLIALVVTIVVLLILAGITISTLFGDNGIISAARKAADDTKTAEEDTSTQLGELANEMKDAMSTRVEPKNIEDWEWIKDEATETITIKAYTGSEERVIIPNYIGGVPVKKIGSAKSNMEFYPIWSTEVAIEVGSVITTEKNDLIKEITISNGIEMIEGGCFACCDKLEKISMPNSVTSIGKYAFFNCKSLTNITIPSSVTNMENFVFAGIPSIKIIVPFKSGNQPSGWLSYWKDSHNSEEIIVQYQQ